MRETINNALLSHFWDNTDIIAATKAMEKRVQLGEKTSFMGAQELLKAYFNN
jgi:hypothetical protein